MFKLNNFISFFGHEMRNKIAVISSASEMLCNYSDDMSKEEILDMNQDIFKETLLIDHYLVKLLYMNRLEQGRFIFQPETIGIKDIFIELNDSLFGTEKKIDYFFDNIDTQYLITFDKRQMKYILLEILENFLEHGKDKCIIHFIIENNNLIIRSINPIGNIGFAKNGVLGKDILITDDEKKWFIGLYLISKILILHNSTFHIKENEDTFSIEIVIPIEYH